MKRLVISWQTYEWAKYCTGMLLQEPDYNYHVIVVCKDNRRPMLGYDGLCSDAIYAQRKHDLFTIGKFLNVEKVYNLGMEPDILNLHRFVAQLQIYLVAGQISEVYYSSYVLLDRIFETFPKKIPIYKYGCDSDKEPDKIHKLTIKEYDKKKQVSDFMIGINAKREKLYFSYTENFYLLK